MNFLIEGFSLFSNSQLCLLFRYLVWSCKDAATFRSLSQVNRYCRELAREHRSMKKVEFSREFKMSEKWPFQGLRGRVLPNGRFHGFAEWVPLFDFQERQTPICVVDGSYSALSFSESYVVYNLYTTRRLFIFDNVNIVSWHNMKNGRTIHAIRCRNCQWFHHFTSSGLMLSRSCWSKQNLHPAKGMVCLSYIKKSRILAIIELAKRMKRVP